MLIDEGLNGCFQLVHASEDSASQLFPGQFAELAFDEVEPRTVHRREVDMKSRVPSQPLLNLRMFVRGVVVDDQMQVHLGHRLVIDGLQDLDPLLMSMVILALRDLGSIEHTQGREERRHAVAFVIMSHCSHQTGEHRQVLQSPIKSLNVLIRWGFRPLSRHTRRTVSLLAPTAAAIERTNHCVSSHGNS